MTRRASSESLRGGACLWFAIFCKKYSASSFTSSVRLRRSCSSVPWRTLSRLRCPKPCCGSKKGCDLGLPLLKHWNFFLWRWWWSCSTCGKNSENNENCYTRVLICFVILFRLFPNDGVPQNVVVALLISLVYILKIFLLLQIVGCKSCNYSALPS